MITSIYQCGVSLYYTLINNNGLWTPGQILRENVRVSSVQPSTSYIPEWVDTWTNT